MVLQCPEAWQTWALHDHIVVCGIGVQTRNYCHMVRWNGTEWNAMDKVRMTKSHSRFSVDGNISGPIGIQMRSDRYCGE